MNVFAKFDKIPSMILEVIKETKRYGHTFGRTVVRSFGRSDNVKTVYPPTNTVCRGYNNMLKYEYNIQNLEGIILKALVWFTEILHGYAR